MNDFKFTLVSTFIFIIIIGLGVLAFYALEPGNSNGSRQIITQLESDIKEKDDALQTALRRITELESDNEQLVEETQEVEETPINTGETTTHTSSQPTLLANLKTLQSKGVVLEPGDQGADVGTIQKFLNVYNNTSGGIDNDFGPGTRSKVEAFQEAERLTADGGVGPGTLRAMVTWLEKN